MAQFESPTCVRNLRHPSNYLNRGTAKSGEAIRVLVYPEDDATKKLIEAVGTLSNDGKSFSVVVTREDSAQQTDDYATGIS
jgi:hypothetical protein